MSNNITMALSLLPQILALLSSLARVLGTNATVLSILNVVTEISRSAEPSYTELKSIKDVIEQMVREGREPTDDEWAILERRSDDAHNEIQSVVIDD